MNQLPVYLVALFALLFVHADRTEQGNLLGQNNININGEADGVVTVNLGPFGTPPTLKCKSDKPTTVGIQCKPANEFPNPLPSGQGIASLALAGYAGMQITSSNPDALCQYELITIDLTSFLTGGSQVTGILCDRGSTPSSTGVMVVPSSSASMIPSSSAAVVPSSSAAMIPSSSAAMIPSSSAAAVVPSSTGQVGEVSSTGGGGGIPTGLGGGAPTGGATTTPTGPAVSTGGGTVMESSTGSVTMPEMSSSTSNTQPASTGGGVVASTGGLTPPPPCTDCGWQNIPCTNSGGQLIAELEQAGIYVFVSIEKILEAVFDSPCDLIGGLNRTIQWAEEFTMECQTEVQNTVNVVTSQVTTKGSADQRHRDCGQDMGFFYDVSLANIQAQFESMLKFTYTEDMLTQAGHCSTCGKYLRWAFFDQVDALWKFPSEPSQVDVNSKECTQNTNQFPSSWAVMYAADVANGTQSDSSSTGGGGGGGGGVPTGLSGIDDRSAANHFGVASIQFISILMMLSLYLVR